MKTGHRRTWLAGAVAAVAAAGTVLTATAAPLRILGQVAGQATNLTLTGLSPNTIYQAVVLANFTNAPTTSSVRGAISTTP